MIERKHETSALKKVGFNNAASLLSKLFQSVKNPVECKCLFNTQLSKILVVVYIDGDIMITD